MMKEEMGSTLTLLSVFSETGFQVSLTDGKARECFLKLMPNRRHIPEAQNRSSNWQRADRHYPCVRCAVRFENILHGRKSPNCLLSATSAARRKWKSLKEIDLLVKKRGQKRRARWTLKRISNLFSKQSLAEWSLPLEELCGEAGLMIEKLCSATTPEPLGHLHLGVSKLLETCVSQ